MRDYDVAAIAPDAETIRQYRSDYPAGLMHKGVDQRGDSVFANLMRNPFLTAEMIRVSVENGGLTPHAAPNDRGVTPDVLLAANRGAGVDAVKAYSELGLSFSPQAAFGFFAAGRADQGKLSALMDGGMTLDGVNAKGQTLAEMLTEKRDIKGLKLLYDVSGRPFQTARHASQDVVMSFPRPAKGMMAGMSAALTG